MTESITLKRRFHPIATHATNLRTYARKAMTSLLDRPITAASDDGICRWHAAELWQTHAKLLKLT